MVIFGKFPKWKVNFQHTFVDFSIEFSTFHSLLLANVNISNWNKVNKTWNTIWSNESSSIGRSWLKKGEEQRTHEPEFEQKVNFALLFCQNVRPIFPMLRFSLCLADVWQCAVRFLWLMTPNWFNIISNGAFYFITIHKKTFNYLISKRIESFSPIKVVVNVHCMLYGFPLKILFFFGYISRLRHPWNSHENFVSFSRKFS